MKNVGLNNLGPIVGGAQDKATRDAKQDIGGKISEFKELLQQEQMRRTLGEEKEPALKFSNHAIERMQTRGIQFSPQDMAKIEQAAAKAGAKGSKNCLLISDQAAMIVSLKDKTVVTVMDKANLKENVFTNIDSTVMI